VKALLLSNNVTNVVLYILLQKVLTIMSTFS